MNARIVFASAPLAVLASLCITTGAQAPKPARANDARSNDTRSSDAHSGDSRSIASLRILNPVTRLTSESFAHPPAADRPWVRVNLPPELSVDELRAEINGMSQAGIAGLEIGQGTFPNSEQLVAILETANQLGLKVSLSHGSTVSPAGFTLDDPNVRKTLLFTAAKATAGADIDLALTPPAPPNVRSFGPPGPPPTPRLSSLVAVLAYRCAPSGCTTSGTTPGSDGPISLDPASVIDLTASVTARSSGGVASGISAGQLVWKAPADGEWQVIALWSQGTYAQPDLYSKEGTAALIRGMEADWTPEVKALLKQNGGDIFYDSHSVDRGSPAELWTNDMEAEFKARRGYSLIHAAPALFEKNFTFADGSAPRVRDDLNAVRGDLWVEKHLKPMMNWAHSFNVRIRLQPYGEPNNATPDGIEAATFLDRPENESLYMGDEVDSYLPLASANHMTGNSWYSTECCAVLNKGYAETFQDLVIRMHRSYAGGITKIVYHVYPYRDAAASKWPGYHSFGQAGFSNAWGPRNPMWIDAPAYNDYLARTQQVLTQGDAKVDVAVYLLSYLYPQPMFVKGGFHFWSDPKLQQAGYTRDYLDPTLLALPAATVTAGRLATPRAAYQAFVIDSEQQPATDPTRSTMPLDAARHVLAFAKAGLPIVIVGAPPSQVPGNAPKEDAQLHAMMLQLTKLPSVHHADHESDVPALLEKLGLHPAMQPAANESPSPLLSIHRHDEARQADYYYLYNEGMITPPGEPANLYEPAEGKPFDRDIQLRGQGRPYLLNAWTGKITPITDYKADETTVSLHIHIAPDDAMLIALSPNPFGVAVNTPAVTKPATFAAIDLTGAKWHLSVEDWKPANPYATVGSKAPETTKELIELDVDGLKPWPQIAQLKSVSGVGTYTASFNMPADWLPGSGATLSLGEVLDSFTVELNGTAIPVNQISATVDAGPYLQPGANTITVRVATTLNNRLADLDPDVAKRNYIQNYGLIGPVTLTAASH